MVKKQKQIKRLETIKKEQRDYFVPIVILFFFLINLLFSLKIKLTGFNDEILWDLWVNQFEGNFSKMMYYFYQNGNFHLFLQSFTPDGQFYPIVWKVFNSIMMTISMVLPVYLVKKNKQVTIWSILVSGSLFFIFPLTFFNEAGWISTTADYLWAYSLALIAIFPMIKYLREEKIGKFKYILGLLALIGLFKQEQLVCLFLIIYIFLLCYFLFNKKSVKPLLPFLIINMINLLILIIQRGYVTHYAQLVSKWLPGFEKISLLNKLKISYATTLNNWFLEKNFLPLIFIFLLFYLTCHSFFVQKQYKLSGFFGLFPFPIVILISWGNQWGLPVIKEKINNWHQLTEITPIQNYISLEVVILLTFILICIFFSMVYLIADYKLAILPNLLILAALFVRMVPIFLPTIWLSATRINLFSYGLLVLVCLFILEYAQVESKAKMRISGVIMFSGLVSFYFLFASV